jgi:hypothetical protein
VHTEQTVSTEKPLWEYADFASANRKLRAIVEDRDIGREFQRYLQEGARELQIAAYRRWVGQIGRAELAARFKEWRARNPERFAKLQRESYRRNYEKNYPRYLTNARDRRARIVLADGSHTSEEVQEIGVCAYCESSLSGSYLEEFLSGRGSSGATQKSLNFR